MYLSSQVIDRIAPHYTALHDVVTVNIPEANEYTKLVPKLPKVSTIYKLLLNIESDVGEKEVWYSNEI